MAKALDTWKVFPHGSFEPLGDSILTLTGRFDMPLTKFERRMTVVRLVDRRLVVFSAIALDEERMNELEAFGVPAFLVVPNHIHRNDAPVWKQRYPELTVVAPAGAWKAAEEVVRVDTTEPDFGDPNVRFVPVAGTNERDSALEVEQSDGLTLILNDVVGNMPHEWGFVLRTMGFAGSEPRVPRVVRAALVKDKAALRAQFEAWAERPVVRIVVSHGATITNSPRDVLRELARSL